MPTTSTIYGVNTEHSRVKPYKHHTDPYEFLALMLVRGDPVGRNVGTGSADSLLPIYTSC
jgi:hypothetical protein